MTMPFPEFDAQLAKLLRDHIPGISAELTDFAVAYWDGHRVVYCFLRDDGNGKLDEEFDPTRYVWAEWHDEFIAWLADPRYSAPPELIGWMNDAPPFDAGA
jgi:hypothetical protein